MRTAVCLALFIAIISVLSLVGLQFSTYAIFLPSPAIALTSISLLALLPLGIPRMSVRTYTAAFAKWAGWCLLALFVIGGFFSPTYFGLLNYYVEPADLMTILATGICYLLVGFELPHKSIAAWFVGLRWEYAIRTELVRMHAKTWLAAHAQPARIRYDS